MTVVFKPHECERPGQTISGTVWQCDDCGTVWRHQGMLILPVGPFGRWRLRRRGLLPAPAPERTEP